MARQKVSDQDIFKAILDQGDHASMRRVAQQLEISQPALHRRLWALSDRGAVQVANPLRLLPGAIDLAAERTWQRVEVNVAVIDGQVQITQT